MSVGNKSFKAHDTEEKRGRRWEFYDVNDRSRNSSPSWGQWPGEYAAFKKNQHITDYSWDYGDKDPGILSDLVVYDNCFKKVTQRC